MTWNIVIDRCKIPPPPYRTEEYTEMPPIVYGPFATEIEAEAEACSDSSVIFALITSDCKKEGWSCNDVFWTDKEVPDDAERIFRTRREVEAELESARDWDDAPAGLVAALEAQLASEDEDDEYDDEDDEDD